MRPNGRKILIVEDNDDSRILMALSLKHGGYEVIEAVDGKEALERAAIILPDLIIMDISMPRLDGLEAAVCLKSDPKTRDIPIIFATAHTRESLLTSATGSGAVEVFLKPLNLAALQDAVNKCLGVTNEISAPPESAHKLFHAGLDRHH